MNSLRMIAILHVFFLIWVSLPVYAEDVNYNFEGNANGIFKIQSMMLIDEMPAHGLAKLGHWHLELDLIEHRH